MTESENNVTTSFLDRLIGHAPVLSRALRQPHQIISRNGVVLPKIYPQYFIDNINDNLSPGRKLSSYEKSAMEMAVHEYNITYVEPDREVMAYSQRESEMEHARGKRKMAAIRHEELIGACFKAAENISGVLLVLVYGAISLKFEVEGRNSEKGR